MIFVSERFFFANLYWNDWPKSRIVYYFECMIFLKGLISAGWFNTYLTEPANCS